MLNRRHIVFPAVLMLLVGCSTIRVSQDYDPDADFVGMSRYAWQGDTPKSTDDVRVNDPLLNQRIRTAIEQTLDARYTRTEPAAADFLLTYTVDLQQKIKGDDTRSGIMVGTGTRGSFGAFGIGTGSAIRSYDQIVLFIDVLDPRSNKLLWRGKGTDMFSEHTEPDDLTRQVHDMVAKILAKFPP